MNKVVMATIVAAAVTFGFLLGRATDERDLSRAPAGSRPSAIESAPSPTSAGVETQHRRILRHVASLGEDDLPTQGVLGGTMVAGTVAFPTAFTREPGQIFYIVGSDGHLEETWTYEMTSERAWKHTGTEQGYAPDDLEDRPAAYDVYQWRPARYVPAPSEG